MKREFCLRCKRKHKSVLHNICAQCASDVTHPIFNRIEDVYMRHYVAQYIVDDYEFFSAIDCCQPLFFNKFVAVKIHNDNNQLLVISVEGADDSCMKIYFSGDHKYDDTYQIKKKLIEPLTLKQLQLLEFKSE